PMRTCPFTTIAHEPHTSSRQLASQTGAGTRSPDVVTGFVRTSISAESTLCCGFQGIVKLCQYGGAPGPSWRFTRSSIVRPSATRPCPDRRVVLPWPWRDEGDVDRLVEERGAVRGPAGLGRSEPPRVVGVRELGLVVRAAALVAPERPEGDDTRQLEHVPELLHEGDVVVGPPPTVADPDAAPAV